MSLFNQIRVMRPKHSMFDLSYDYKLSLKMGKLVPVHLQECVPGDIFHMQSEAMFRMMPMIAPIMHKVDIFFHNFFCPNRLLWPSWEKFITGGPDGVDNPSFPKLIMEDVEPSSLANYLGLPVTSHLVNPVFGNTVSALPFAAYQRIWYEFYRDQNLQDEAGVVCTDGIQSVGQTAYFKTLRDRAWEHDYFTACLPFAQKGAPVTLPLDTTAMTITASQTGIDSPNQPAIRKSSTGALEISQPIGTDAAGDLATAGGKMYLDPRGSLEITGDAGATINDLRAAFRLQEWLEKNARAGSRYIENILAHFGVRSSDERLSRPEYLGGSKASMAISEVLQTSSTDGTTPQANMAGHGISVTAGKHSSYKVEEHGYIMTILSIRPKTAYYNGIPKHFTKYDRTEFGWPTFANLGEQPVKNEEIVATGDPAVDNETFGYLPRYAEYKFNFARVAGQMATTLEFWHMGRKFDMTVAPALNDDFVICNPTKRIFAVELENEDEIVAHVFHKIMAKRPFPKYGTPGIY